MRTLKLLTSAILLLPITQIQANEVPAKEKFGWPCERVEKDVYICTNPNTREVEKVACAIPSSQLENLSDKMTGEELNKACGLLDRGLWKNFREKPKPMPSN